jgi:hypothetical protein
MSWRNSIAVVLIPLWLAGCGFKPLYGQKTDANEASKVFAGVKIDAISGSGHVGQELQTNLEDRLNPNGVVPASPAYRLKVKLMSSIMPIGVARDNTVSRYNVYLTSQYVLYRNSDGKPVTSGDVGYVDSYNNLTNAYFSTYTSQEDAMKRGLVELSELYRQRLAAYLEEGAPVQAVTLPNPDAVSEVPHNPLLFAPRKSGVPVR